MSPLARILFDLLPYALACAAGALIPRRRGWLERAALGIIAALSLLAIRALWPDASAPLPEPGSEWKPLLTVVVFLPILAAVAVLFMPRQSPDFIKRFTLGVLAADFIASLWLLSVPWSRGWQFQHIQEWIPALGIRYHVAVDGISAWLVLLCTLTTPIAAYVSFGSIRARIKDLCFAYLLLHGGMLGAFVSLDLFLFFVFWELMLIPMIVLIGVWGGIDRIKAAYKFFLFTMVGSMLMLAAILYMAWSYRELSGAFSFDYLALSRLVLPREAGWLCFLGFFLAFAVKVPMFPFHTWLPDAHVQAPTGGSIILAAVLLKLGTYGYIRFCMGMLGGPAWVAAATLAGVAILGGILYGSLVAWKQDDVKRLVAYSSVAHMGFVMLGIFSGTQAGLEGSMLQMINHGISTGALFLLVGVIYDRRHTRMVQEFGGLAKVMPVYAALFVIVTLSSIGVPGTNGFVGEFLVLMGTFVSSTLGPQAKLQAGGAAIGVILAAVYMLSVVKKMFFGPLENPKNRRLQDVNVREVLALAPLVALIFVIGLFPNLFLSRMSEGVRAVLDRYEGGMRTFSSVRLVEGGSATLAPRRGGPLERGYPELKVETEADSQAANTEAAP